MSGYDESDIRESTVDDIESRRASSESIGSASMDSCLKDVEDMKFSMSKIRKATEEINKSKDDIVAIIGSEEEKRLIDRVNNTVAESNQIASQIKKRLDDFKLETDNMVKSKNVSEIKMRQNLHATTIRQLIKVIKGYQQAQTQFKNTVKEKFSRQIKVVKPKATDEEINTIVNTGDAGMVYRNAMLRPGLDPVAITYLNAQDRLKDIQSLERSVEELHRMFIDLTVAVDAQSETIDLIVEQVLVTRDYVSKANVELELANKHRRAFRRKICCLACLMIILTAIILGVVLKVLNVQ